MRKYILSALLVLFPLQNLFAAGAFTGEQYKKALWMVTRFYGAQRSGIGPNWLLMDHTYKTSFTLDADGSHNLEGGWFDCGDHVLFGQTFFYSAYMLAKAYETFPKGFHDLYHGNDYSDYMESGDWSIDGGKPNRVPDLLEELKYATDWIIKATPNATTFYYEKGNGDYDHKKWVTAGYMSTLPTNEGGEPRPIAKNPNDGRMASFAAAALAVMSKVYREYNEAYADLALEHAKIAYAYAKAHKNQSVGAATGGFYGAAKDPATTFNIAAAEMYMATGENTYKSDFDKEQIKDHYWAFDYENPHDLAAYAAAMAFAEDKNTYLDFMNETFIKGKYTQTQKINGEKISTVGNASWGALRYPANHAFSAALYSNAKGTEEYDQFIYNQIDYILGNNNSNQSFIVGFCEGCTKEATKPHHRNVYLNDNNPSAEERANISIPARNKYFGYMVGGSFNSSEYKDGINDYEYTEGGLDYNAGLLGALAYIVSKEAPADKIEPPPEEPGDPEDPQDPPGEPQDPEDPQNPDPNEPSPIKLQPNKMLAGSSVIRFVGAREFPARSNSFVVRVFNIKGDMVSVIKSDGRAVRFVPQNIGVYYATVR